MVRMSKGVASSSKNLWNEYVRFTGNSKIPAPKKNIVPTVPNTKDVKSVQRGIKLGGALNVLSAKEKGVIPMALTKRKGAPAIVMTKGKTKKVIPIHNQLQLPIAILKQNTRLCHNSPYLQYIIYVHSAVGHFAKRRIIRQTWGNKNLFKNHRTAVVFIVGKPKKPAVQRRLDKEFKTFGDLVQGDFMDSYQNMALKAALGFQFLSTRCSHVPYAIKADDDVVVDIFRVLDMVRKHKHRTFIMCFHRKDRKILRSNKPQSKAPRWAVPDYMFPGQKTFPPHCAGLGYVLSTKVLVQMYELAKSTPYTHMDDVYTGLLMNKLSNLQFIDVSGKFPYESWTGRPKYFAVNRRPKFLFTVYSRDVGILWQKMIKFLNEKDRKLINPMVQRMRYKPRKHRKQ